MPTVKVFNGMTVLPLRPTIPIDGGVLLRNKDIPVGSPVDFGWGKRNMTTECVNITFDTIEQFKAQLIAYTLDKINRFVGASDVQEALMKGLEDT